MEQKLCFEPLVPKKAYDNDPHLMACSKCTYLLSVVQCKEHGHVIGLACEKCQTFWPLILPKFD